MRERLDLSKKATDVSLVAGALATPATVMAVRGCAGASATDI